MNATYHPPRFIIPVKVAIVVTTLVSTVVSLVAGYLLYNESVAILKETVEEQSAVLSRTAVTRFRSLFDDHIHLLDSVERFGIAKSGDTFENLNELSHAVFSNLRSFPQLHGAAIRLVPKYRKGMNKPEPWNTPHGHSAMWIWYDPLLSKDTSEYEPYDSNENKMFIHCLGHPSLGEVDGYPHIERKGDEGYSMNMVCYELNKTTGRQEQFIYVSEERSIKEGWELFFSGGSRTLWSDPTFWYSMDNTPYSYLQLTRSGIAPGFAPDHDVLVQAFLALKTWEYYILDYANGEDTMFVINGELGLVHAHTLFVAPGVYPGCYSKCVMGCDSGEGTCGLPFSYFGPTLQTAVNAGMSSVLGEFRIVSLPSTHRRVLVRFGEYFEASDVDQTNPIPKIHTHHEVKMEGGEWFLRMSEIYSYPRKTGFGRFEVLWMRPVSTVNDKVFAALVQLILCCTVIFVMDALIAVAEMLLLARPLAKLAYSITFIETLDLVKLNEVLDNIYTNFGATEVVRLISGIKYAASCLSGYKAHLPGNLFVEPDDLVSEEESEVPEENSTSTRSESVEASSESVTSPGESRRVVAFRSFVSAVGLNTAKGVVLTVEFPMTAITDKVSDVISVVETAVSSTRGVLHGFGAADVVLSATWNIVTKREAPVLKSMRATDAIRRHAGATLAMALSNGTLKAGNLGSNSTKGFALGGNAMLRLQAQRVYSRALSSNTSTTIILVEGSIFTDTHALFHCYSVGFIVADEKKLPMYSLGKEKDQQNEEWMYTMESAGNDPNSIFEKARWCKTVEERSELLRGIDTTDPAQKWFIDNWLSTDDDCNKGVYQLGGINVVNQ
eukprot:TRINITY_DN3348_c0_g1_i1.p1 TRINITY_DN3348_c0_g1~~TRINITY_DN3348_c0_g1_i1.p1  ORF type:complete len:837 (+),score=145.22 TRINITY_DN3348_c0_g1_i1:1178-3688(+)